MALISIDPYPSQSVLAWFGVTMLVFFVLIGGMVRLGTGEWTAPLLVWTLGAVLTLIYYALRPLRRPLYLGWMHLLFPIGWVMSHLVLGLMYYLVITPIGLLMRALGRDPMQRRFEPDATSYWVPHRAEQELSQYFHQF
ncbi:SxtJ family membrane protein [Candidatus Thiosymbion oneisti]|uniref:SxtJ family membrane protein n=1 Tax=Candidatus Thiosymbion oneisti TaxID=589554 RepID=UPI000B7D28C7|nr:SxtJ family membrane protein [Candidatus Thiosymbion oneisti]